ncbi:MAG TPA: 30S ribosome-binding factor RbfA [Candidatus Nanopelagicales bacterium]|jgi:ribosome-binding factor A
MVDRARARKLADRIRVVVAETLEMRVKDPRLGFITITEARVTNDLHDATVYYTVYGDDHERTATAMALESAKGVLRTEVGRQTGVRFTPTLTFVADIVPETAAHIEDLIAVAAKADAVVHEQAATAAYSGEADPYRKSRDIEEDDEAAGTDDADDDDDDLADAGDQLAGSADTAGGVDAGLGEAASR